MRASTATLCVVTTHRLKPCGPFNFGPEVERLDRRSAARSRRSTARPPYMLGFHSSSYSGGGQNARGCGSRCAPPGLYYGPLGWLVTIDKPIREAWADAYEIVDGGSLQWADMRAGAAGAPTYNERLRVVETTDPREQRSFWTARGTC